MTTRITTDNITDGTIAARLSNLPNLIDWQAVICRWFYKYNC